MLGDTGMKQKKDLIIHSWVSRLCSYYSDFIEPDSDVHKLYAEMAIDLIPSFLKDFGINTIKINNVLWYSYNLNGFVDWMKKNHPYIKVEMFKL